MTAGITGLDHVSVIVTNSEHSRHFYGTILGLREIASPKTFSFPVIWYDFGPQQLHLLVKNEPDSQSPRHFALKIENALASRSYFLRLGIPIAETTPVPGADRFFIYDPDGNRIELIQWVRPYDPTTDGKSV